MNKKLKVGDKFKWDALQDLPSLDYTYTVKEFRIENGVIEVLVQWTNVFNDVVNSWLFDLKELNDGLNKGVIILVGNTFQPIKDIKKFKL
jgi:hypothetical protein